MILGSHNSLTYNKCTNIFCNLIRFTWRCQNVDIYAQYLIGVRCFDFRLYYDNGVWKAAHGHTKFNVNFYEILHWLNNSEEQIYVRVVYEGGSEMGEHSFAILCNEWEHTFSNIKFFEGTKKKGWKILYHFKYTPHPYIVQYVSSMQETNIIKKILPYRYAKKYNKEKYKESLSVESNQIILFDFVELI